MGGVDFGFVPGVEERDAALEALVEGAQIQLLESGRDGVGHRFA